MDRSAPGSLAADQATLEAFLSLPLSRIGLGTNDGRDDQPRRMPALGRQHGVDGHGVDGHGVDEGVTFNSGI